MTVRSSFVRLTLSALVPVVTLLSSTANGGDIVVTRNASTLQITGGGSRDAIAVYFNAYPNQPNRLFVRVTNSSGKVISNGDRTKAAQDFDLAGITRIQVSLLGEVDSLQFLHGAMRKSNWYGELELDFGTRPSTTQVHETLVLRGPMKLRRVNVSGNRKMRNETIDTNVVIDSHP